MYYIMNLGLYHLLPMCIMRLHTAAFPLLLQPRQEAWGLDKKPSGLIVPWPGASRGCIPQRSLSFRNPTRKPGV